MTFDEWLELHSDTLQDLVEQDAVEALHQAWLAGYESGLDKMGEMIAPSFNRSTKITGL